MCSQCLGVGHWLVQQSGGICGLELESLVVISQHLGLGNKVLLSSRLRFKLKMKLIKGMEEG